MVSINDLWITESTRLFLLEEWPLYLPNCCIRNLAVLGDSSTGEAPCSYCGVLFSDQVTCPSCGAPRREKTGCKFDVRGYLPEALVFVGLRTPFTLSITFGWIGDPSCYEEEDVIAKLYVDRIIEQVIPSLGIISADPPEVIYMAMSAVGSIEFRKDRNA